MDRDSSLEGRRLPPSFRFRILPQGLARSTIEHLHISPTRNHPRSSSPDSHTPHSFAFVRADRGSDSRPDGPARAAVHQRKTKQTRFANSGNLTRDTVKPTERTWPALDDETNRRIFKITRTGTSPGSLGTANRLRVLWVTTTLALEDTLGHRTTANRSRVL